MKEHEVLLLLAFVGAILCGLWALKLEVQAEARLTQVEQREAKISDEAAMRYFLEQHFETTGQTHPDFWSAPTDNVIIGYGAREKE